MHQYYESEFSDVVWTILTLKNELKAPPNKGNYYQYTWPHMLQNLDFSNIDTTSSSVTSVTS